MLVIESDGSRGIEFYFTATHYSNDLKNNVWSIIRLIMATVRHYNSLSDLVLKIIRILKIITFQIDLSKHKTDNHVFRNGLHAQTIDNV